MSVEELVLADLGVDLEEASARRLVGEYMRSPAGLTAVEVLWLLANVIHGPDWTLVRIADLGEQARRDRNEGRREALRWACR